jgi:hypothetical protein
VKRAALLVLLALGCKPAAPVQPTVVRHEGAHVSMARTVGQADVINFNPQGVSTTATPGAVTVQNVAGVLTQVNDQGAATPLGGGGGTAFVSAAQTRARALSGGVLDSTKTTYGEWFEEFVDTARFVSSGFATATLSTTLKGGVLVFATGTTTGASDVEPLGSKPIIINPTTDVVYLRFRAQFAGPVDTGGAMRVGLVATTGSGFTHFGIIGVGSGSLTNFVVEAYDGTLNPINATAALIDTASFHDVEFYSTAVTGTWYLDGVAMTPTIAMNALGGHPMTVDIGSVFVNNAVNHVVNIDKAYASFLAQ